MSENTIRMECFPVNQNIENFSSDNLLVPTSKDVIELNKLFLETSLDNTSKDPMNAVPYFAGPSNVVQPKSQEMQFLHPHQLSGPIRISLPDGVEPDGPIILLDRPFNSNSNKDCNKATEDSIKFDFINQNQNVNNISSQNGLPPVPNKLNNQNDKSTIPIVVTPVQENNNYSNNMSNPVNDTKFDLPSHKDDNEMPFQLPLNNVPQELPENNYTPKKFKAKSGNKSNNRKKMFKKILMWIAIALVLYLIYLIFKKK
jgi:hypothetical protein